MTTENILVSVREAATAEIKQHLDNIGTSYLRVGSCLNELRGDFEGQKDFLAYVESEFGIKKAQCYKLMSVARVFEGDDRFKGVAMRVMLALVPFADEDIIMEKAAELAAGGKLDTNAVNVLIEPKKEPKAEMVQSKAETVKPQENAADAAESQETQEPQAVPPVSEPDNDESAPWEEESKPEAPKAAPLDNTANTEHAAMAGLLAQIKALTEQLQAANDRIAALTSARESKKAAAPMLPQFKSSCFYARLGLSAEEATKKTAVNKARRELVKLGYGEGHEAWPLISEAVEELTK
ncbi:endolysin [Escherichia phage vB_EcolP_P433.1]|uniref:Endolysin n=1 Tax=Escherichia phage vB_EcolP_P433.1 TaxID=2653657 RepID=A0AAE6P0A7_9CAUD|nr:endolysin [Escherichia phage vB_EcolP_P433.1]